MKALLLLSGLGGTLGCSHLSHSHGPASGQALAQMVGLGDSQVRGQIKFEQQGDNVRIVGRLSGLKASANHAIHIHEFGDCSAKDGASAGPHYNPSQKPHGEPGKGDHHVGDLGNLAADAQGSATLDVRIQSCKLEHMVGRSMIVHANPDDFKSQPAGNAGPRISCGVIGWTQGQSAN